MVLEPPPAAPASPAEEPVIGHAKVTASALNVRSEPATSAEIVTRLKRGARVPVLAREEGWTRVKLEEGGTGWVASRFLATEGEKRAASRGRKGCPPDSDFAFLETPTLAFSDSGAHGLVVVDATVTAAGKVTSTKIISNDTGDEALAFLAEREIRSATFAAPIRNCAPRSFIFTYRRTF